MVIVIEPKRVLRFAEHELRGAEMIMESVEGELRHGRFYDKPTKWRREGDALIVTTWNEKTERTCRLLPATPAWVLDALEPMELPDPMPLPREEVARISEELASRARRDQNIRRWWNAPPEELDFVACEDTAYVVDVIQKVGWIDSARFGDESAFFAWLLCQHSRDNRLRLAMLPYLADEVRGGGMHVSCYVNTLDRALIFLALPQLYGTQFATLDDATWIYPVDSERAVDERRALAQMGGAVENVKWIGKPVRFEPGPR